MKKALKSRPCNQVCEDLHNETFGTLTHARANAKATNQVGVNIAKQLTEMVRDGHFHQRECQQV